MEKTKKNSKKIDLLLTIFIGVMLVAMCYCGYRIISQKLEYRAGEAYYESLSVTYGPENQAELQEINSQFCGWLTLEGTELSYPVVQGEDNSFYLNHLFNQSENSVGTVFMHELNHADLRDDNTILYGHHLSGSTAMFGLLENYNNQSFYDMHPDFTYYTQNQEYRVELIAGFAATSTTELPIIFKDEENRNAFIEQIRENSTFDSSVIVDENDKLITFVTCAYEEEGARYIVVGKLIEDK